ncbi:hypothetical protein WDW37_08725 [Bdellovibrionota bacterium FG-1]
MAWRNGWMLKALVSSCGVVLLSGPACLSTQTQTSLDGTVANSPYVEAYIEYPGPHDKWSGPATFLLHVQAKDNGPAQISITPAWAKAEPVPGDVTVSTRVPASGLNVSAQKPTMASPMPSEAAREMLSHMSNALSGATTPFKGCMSPVRVRLVRADGALTEKQGCRSDSGWARAISESANVFITASIYGFGNAPAPVAAATAPVVARVPAAAGK